jgi:proteic killer suppression protein
VNVQKHEHSALIFLTLMLMIVTFRTKKLAKACNSEAEMLRHFGQQRAAKLGMRLLELKAAANLNDISRLPPARCHELTGSRKGQLSLDLGHPYRLIIIPAKPTCASEGRRGLGLGGHNRG